MQEQAIARLREEIESVVGRKMKTPKDFDFLAGQIFDKLHENVSSTTLKRIWGYLSEPSTPRLSTLDILARFLDYIDFYWGRQIPNYQGIFIWGPEYGNPTWGNKGDSAAMMPTISVHWSLDNVSQEEIDRRNSDSYYLALHRNELRLTFMKNLVDTGYVFLGVYRLSKTESDTTHNVWERVVDDLYLHDLYRLYKYRN